MKRDTRFLTMAIRSYIDSFLAEDTNYDRINALTVAGMATNVIMRNLTMNEREIILSSKDSYAVSSVVLPYLDVFLTNVCH